MLTARPPLGAQTTGTAASSFDAERVFAPFVSKIAVAEKDGKVALTWTDSRDAAGQVIVYRSDQPISAERISRLEQLAEVPYGAQSYIDKPPRSATWRYFVAATDASGVRYDVVLPYGNSVEIRVDLAEAAPAEGDSKKPTEHNVSGVNAQVQGDSVRITFRAAQTVSNILVYRSASPLNETRDLLDAVIIQSTPAAAAIVIDYPVPGIGYFYALVPEEDLKGGSIALIPGLNATTVPVEVPPGRYRVGLPGPPHDLRSMPLPLISLDAAMPSGAVGPQPPANPVPLSAAASKAVSELLGPVVQAKYPERRPRAFPQDLETPVGGEEYALRSIVQGAFAKREWEDAAKQIARYLSLSRTPATEARAHYYLGQSYFFSGRFSEALFEFLLVQSQYHAEAQEWIDAILPRLISVSR
jgi:hypothetical protein